MEVIEWCAKVEELLIAAGASPDEAQDHIEENADWFTDMFYTNKYSSSLQYV